MVNSSFQQCKCLWNCKDKRTAKVSAWGNCCEIKEVSPLGHQRKRNHSGHKGQQLLWWDRCWQHESLPGPWRVGAHITESSTAVS